jgi:hypothetical protein
LAIIGWRTDDAVSSNSGLVRVVKTHLGKAVFAQRCYPQGSIIGEITGRIFEELSESDDYTFEYEDRMLDPIEPYRYLNHSCAANCEFDTLDIPESDEGPACRGLFLMAIEDIRSGEELTIDYNWPAAYAITCLCRSDQCRGWVVSEDELPLLNSQKTNS